MRLFGVNSPHFMSRIILVGASGYLGHALIQFLRDASHEITVVSRHDPQLDVKFIKWDGETMGHWARAFDGADAVINLAGRTVNCRYDEKNKRQILDSRVKTTTLIGRAIAGAGAPPKVWLNAASATIYRDARQNAMDEATGEIGSGFSVDVCRAWEQTLFEAPVDCRRVAMRLAMVFGAPRGGVHDAFEILVKLGFGGPMAGGKQYISWIHLHDFCRAAAFLLENKLEGPINIAAPQPLTNAQFLSTLRRSLNVPYALPTARWQLEIGAFAGRTETELLLKSRRAVPTRLLDAGFKFDYPDWPSAARAIVSAH